MTQSTPPPGPDDGLPPATAPAVTPAAPPPVVPQGLPPAPTVATPIAATTVRPTGATVISIIDGIIGVLALLAGVLVMVGMSVVGGLANNQPDSQGVGGVVAGVGLVFGIIIVLIGVLYLAISYGVWKGRTWAWMLGMVVSIVAIVLTVLGLGNGISVGTIVSLALPIVVVYFLWQPDVKRWLGRPV